MKVFIFTRKSIVIISFIVVIIIVAHFLHASYKMPESMAIELMCNSVASVDFKNRVKVLAQGEEKVVYLTFDDGPNSLVTPKILDILEKKNVKATFFVIGKNVEQHPEIVKRAYEEGHYIANHGYDHNNKNLYKSKESFINEIKKTDLAIGNAIGVEDYCSHVFRFPNGFMSPNNKEKKKETLDILSELDYTYIDWNCLNNDSVKKYTKEQLLNNLKKTAKGKNTLVILMHDTKDVNDSSLVLEESINYLEEQGYELKNFYDLL